MLSIAGASATVVDFASFGACANASVLAPFGLVSVTSIVALSPPPTKLWKKHNNTLWLSSPCFVNYRLAVPENLGRDVFKIAINEFLSLNSAAIPQTRNSRPGAPQSGIDLVADCSEHDPKKWVTGFPKRSCSNKKIQRDDVSKKSHPALGANGSLDQTTHVA